MHTARRCSVLLLTVVMLGLLAAPAWAHVSVKVDNPAPEAFAKYTVRVPNEADDAETVKVEVQLPDGYDEIRYQPLAGWDISVADGTLIIEGGELAPGTFQEFGFSTQNPAEEGDVTFPAIQTYSNGDVVRWVGDPDSDKPAAVVAISASAPGAAAGHGATDDDATEDPATDDTATEAASRPAATDDDAAEDAAEDDAQGSSTLSILALIAGVLGLGLGGAAFAKTR